MEDTTRRSFLEQAGLGTAGLITAGYTATARGFAKNETIHIGVIGAGGRVGRALLPKLKALPGVKITAVCDVYDPHLEHARSNAEPGAFTTKRHEELLARKDVDAVIIGTPDHWHVPITVDACAAGKDVYCEKPLTHKMDEAQQVVEAQDRHHRVVQVGTQQRSMPQFARAREVVRSGKLGDIHKVHMTWNRNHTPFRKRVRQIDPAHVDWKRFLGNAPDQPFDPYRFIGNWRWFWDFGGGILTDLMVHWLDAVNWLLELPMPASATTVGNQFSTAGVWQTPDTIQTLLQYPEKKLQLHFEGTFVNAHEKAGVTLMGTGGTLYVDRGRYELYPEPRRSYPPEKQVLGSGARGADFDIDGSSMHLADWLKAIRTRQKPSAPAEAGALAASAAHLGNQAFRENRVATWSQ